MIGAVVLITQNAEDGAKSAYEINWHISGLDDRGEGSALDAPNLSNAEHIRFANTIEKAERIAYGAKTRYVERGIPCQVYLVRDGDEGLVPYDFDTYRAHQEERPGALSLAGPLAMPRQAAGDPPPGRRKALERRWDPAVLDEFGIQVLQGADGRWYWRKRDTQGRFLDNSLGGFLTREQARADARRHHP